MNDCTYCGCEVEAHHLLAVYETADGDGVGDGVGDECESGTVAGEFCNWGCLAACVAESDVATGTSCNWTPSRPRASAGQLTTAVSVVVPHVVRTADGDGCTRRRLPY